MKETTERMVANAIVESFEKGLESWLRDGSFVMKPKDDIVKETVIFDIGPNPYKNAIDV